MPQSSESTSADITEQKRLEAPAPEGKEGAPAASGLEKNWPPDRRLAWGLIALLLWLLIFAAGVLIPSEQSRERLGWSPKSSKQEEMEKKIGEVEQKVEVLEQTNPAGTISPAEVDARISKAISIVRADMRKKSAGGLEFPKKIGDFLIATISYTQLNTALLCILAAFIGGCSVNKEAILEPTVENRHHASR